MDEEKPKVKTDPFPPPKTSYPRRFSLIDPVDARFSRLGVVNLMMLSRFFWRRSGYRSGVKILGAINFFRLDDERGRLSSLSGRFETKPDEFEDELIN